MGGKEPLTHGLVYHCLTNMGWSTWFPLRGKHSGWWLVSGLYWGLYDRLWESLATSNYKHCSSGSGNSWGFVRFFWVDVYCFSNGWSGWSSCVIEFGEDWRHGQGRNRNEIPGGVEILHFWIFSQHFWRVHAAKKRRWEDGDWAEHVEWRWQKCGHLTQKTMCKQCTNAGMWPKNRDAWDQPCQFLNVTRAAPCWE